MIAVTGATGHVGNVLVRELIRRGERVYAVVPPSESLDSLAGLDCEITPGDVCVPWTLDRALRGAGIVYHLAGIISISGGTRGLLHRVNVEGTRNVVQACLRCRVRRLVYTSSVHALVEPPHGTPVCETSDFSPEALLGDYARSKARASIEILKGVEQGLDAVMVFPSGIIGPCDFKLSEMGQLILDIARGRLKAYVDGAYDFVDVRDVVSGLILAAEKGRSGQGYILSGELVTVRDLISLVQELAGHKVLPRRMPFWLARAAAVFAPAYYRLKRARPRFTNYSLKVLASNCLMDRRKAESELGYSPRPLRESVDNTLEWFRETGKLPGAGQGAVA